MSEIAAQNQSISTLETVCKGIISASDGILNWKWDDRLEAALSEFNVSIKDDIRSILEKHLILVWDGTNNSESGHKEKASGHPISDVRPGQMLYISGSIENDSLFCAWWPWGDGKTISIRITSLNSVLTEKEKAEQLETFRNWFGI